MTPPLPAAPEPFPEAEAARLLDAAGQLDLFYFGLTDFVEMVEWVVQCVRDVIGDHTVPTRLAMDWGTEQAVPSGVANDLTTQLASLSTYWDGGAFSAFNIYADRMIGACDATAEKMGEVALLLTNAITLVHDTYASAIGYLIKSAGACVGMFRPDEWPSVLADLVANVGDLIDRAITTMGGYRADAVSFNVVAAGFPAPAELPPEVADPGSWPVAEAPATLPD